MDAPIPYEGNESYIFVSYSHRDDAAAWTLIEALQGAGFRVWFDRGAVYDAQQDLRIARRLETCGCFLSLITPNYLASVNCRADLDFADRLGKDRLAVFQERVSLTRDMAMRLCHLQAIHRSAYDTDRAFYDAVFALLRKTAVRPEATAPGRTAPDGPADRYVFVSYSSKERTVATRLCGLLEAQGVRCWIAPDSIPVGSEYTEAIVDAIEQSDGVVLLLSANSQNSKWVPKELDIAITAGKTIFPVRIDRAGLIDKMRFRLSDSQIIEANGDVGSVLIKLTAAIKGRWR